MKNIVCPVSIERIPEHVPRITALLVICSLLVYFLTGFVPILAFLLIDFIARGLGFARFSLLHIATLAISQSFNLKSDLIGKAPKLFAARLGAVMISIALLLELLSISNGALVIAVAVSFFATLECVLNFCLGCYVYSLVVFPFYNKRSK